MTITFNMKTKNVSRQTYTERICLQYIHFDVYTKENSLGRRKSILG